MVPTRNLLHHDGKNSSKSYYHPGQFCVGIAAQLEASSAAASQDYHKPSRSPWIAMAGDADELAAAAGTSSRGGAGDDGEWLQLGLATVSSSSTSSSGDINTTAPVPPPMELDLFTYDKRNTRMRPPLFPLPLRSYQSYGNGRYRAAAAVAASGSMSAPFLPPFRSSGDAMRVVSPPRRAEAAGLWLTLQAATNQARESILPQIPKSYLRIKDSNMKVEVVMKYLADKLGLTRSHQVELTCRGQLLPPFLLVKYVRDSIWCSSTLREQEALVELPARRSPAAATTDHVMTLYYSTSSNH
ncbi:protein LAX PANICLE 2-like [Phragmites australis]|uniref:protein LAX PANICLE 2-like n=1 Tax=Phragmites australis TaxID=29695 RepID=UPI002D79BD2B|nr:protein LAX PANICLE 2-like [Phragmites australis]